MRKITNLLIDIASAMKSPAFRKRRQFRRRTSYLALGQAYEARPELSQAQAALQTGLSLAKAKSDDRYEALFTN
jgi:hypothetical protein